MKILQTLLIAVLLFSTSLILTYNISSAKAIPPAFLARNINFGPLLGVVQNTTTGTIDWLISGTWKSSLSNTTTTQSPNVFDAAIEMIKPDGIGRHTHALSNFTLQNVSHPNTNTTMFNGVSTVGMKEGPISNVPTTILLTNGKVLSIIFDPQTVQHHFGNSPFFGIIEHRGPDLGPMGGPMGR